VSPSQPQPDVDTDEQAEIPSTRFVKPLDVVAQPDDEDGES
jgi:hypothetical protein